MHSGITANYSMGQILQLFFQEPRVEVWNWSEEEIAHLRRIQKKREIYRLTNNEGNPLKENGSTINKLEEDNHNMNLFCSHDESYESGDVSHDVHNDVIENVGQSVRGRKRKFNGGFYFLDTECSVSSVRKRLIPKDDVQVRHNINGNRDRSLREPRKRQEMCDIVTHYFDCIKVAEFLDSSDTEDHESGEVSDENKGKVAAHAESSDTLRNSELTGISSSNITPKNEGSQRSKCVPVTNTRLLVINMSILIINVALKLKMLYQKLNDSSSMNTTRSYKFLLQDAKNYIKLTKPEVLRVHRILLTRMSHRALLRSLFPIVNGILSRMENKHELSKLCVYDVLYKVLEVTPKMDRSCDAFLESTSVSDESNDGAKEIETDESSNDGVKQNDSGDICKAAFYAQNVLQKIMPKISQHVKPGNSQRNPKCEFSHIFRKAKSDAIKYNRSFKRPCRQMNVNIAHQEEVWQLQKDNPKTSAHFPMWSNSSEYKIKSDQEYRLVRGIVRTNAKGINRVIPAARIDSPTTTPTQSLRFLYKRKCFTEHKGKTHKARESAHPATEQNETVHSAPVKVLGNPNVKLPSHYRTENPPNYTSLDHSPSASLDPSNREHTIMRSSNIGIIPGRKTHTPGVSGGFQKPSETHKTSGFNGSVTTMKVVQVLAIECLRTPKSQIKAEESVKVSEIERSRNEVVFPKPPMLAVDVKKEPAEGPEHMADRVQGSTNTISKQNDEIVVFKKEKEEITDDHSHNNSTVLRKCTESECHVGNDESYRNTRATNSATPKSSSGGSNLADRLVCVCCAKPAAVACAGCRARYYCNDICQDGDWRFYHGRICNRQFI